MNCFLLLFITVYLGVIRADVINITPDTRGWTYQSDRPVNKPTTTAFIRIYNAISNTSIDQFDASAITTKVNYTGNTITFTLTILSFSIGDEIYVTFDAGVLYSNATDLSPAQTNRSFLYFKVVELQTSTALPYTSQYTSMATTQYPNTATSMMNNNTNTYTSMSGINTQTSDNPTVQISTTPAAMMNTGEPPPTRSAQIGMGLGITFITALIIIEIVYFKFCYTGNGRSESYYT